MRLSAENTAVVIDSTADLPDPEGRHPNWRLVPLYVRFGEETFREYVEISAEEFYVRFVAGDLSGRNWMAYPNDFNNFGPRVGFAWDPRDDGRMVGATLFFKDLTRVEQMEVYTGTVSLSQKEGSRPTSPRRPFVQIRGSLS